jgi:hypothetical protein
MHRKHEMRVLFDKNVPVPLRQSLTQHQVRTAAEQGWGTLSNGELIAQAEKAGFDLLLTCDQNLTYQQNLSRHRLSMVVLGSNIWPSVLSKLAEIVSAVDRAKPRSFEFIEIPPGRRR